MSMYSRFRGLPGVAVAAQALGVFTCIVEVQNLLCSWRISPELSPVSHGHDCVSNGPVATPASGLLTNGTAL